MRLTTAVMLLLVTVCPLLADEKPAGDWQNIHMASFANVEDVALLAEHGINVVLVNITHDPATWKKYYEAAVANRVRLVPMLWAVHQTAWVWHVANEEWELDAKKYPNSIGAKFLAFLSENPKFLEATFAIYAFHEPHNPEVLQGLVPSNRQRKFWRQVREMFADGSLKVYGESIAWHRETRNGCVDYDGWSLMYPFVRIDGRAMYRPYHWVVGRGLGGIEQWPGPETDDAEAVKANYRQVIDSLHGLIQQAEPADDGSRTRLVVLIQTYAIDGRKDLWNRMPTAAEMRAWGLEVVGQRINKLAGLNWYCYRKAANFYTHCLATDRKDDAGEDRLLAIREVAQRLAVGLQDPGRPTTAAEEMGRP